MQENRIGIALVAAALTACGGAATSPDVGVARIALTGTPAAVACIGVTVTGSRTVSRLFAAQPGTNQTFTMMGLPLGNDTFQGTAFSLPCDVVTSGTIADWLSDGVAAALAAGAVTNVSLVLRHNGVAQVGIGFEEEDAGAGGAGGSSADAGAAGTDGASDASVCGAGLTPCQSSCVNLQTNRNNCGSCGNVCVDDIQCNSTDVVSCQSGTCHVSFTGLCF